MTAGAHYKSQTVATGGWVAGEPMPGRMPIQIRKGKIAGQ
jgi:hypothetical protein